MMLYCRGTYSTAVLRLRRCGVEANNYRFGRVDDHALVLTDGDKCGDRY
jgi:hypothetical protein